MCILPSFLHKTEEIPFWVRFGYGSHLKAKLFSTSRLACLAGKSYLHGIALPDFYIVISFFHKKSKQARVPTFVWFSVTMPLPRKVPDVTMEQIYVYAISR